MKRSTEKKDEFALSRVEGHSSLFGEIGSGKTSHRIIMLHVSVFAHFAPVAAAVAGLRLISQNTIQFNFTGNKI